jgi:hypothetical protein
MRVPPTITAILAAALLVPALASCSFAPPAAAPDDAPASAPAAEEEPAPAPAAGSGSEASWANPVTIQGDLITTIKGDGFTVDIYQAGTTAATKEGNFVTPDDKKPIIAVGAEIVYVNYVFTNTGTEAIPLSYSLATVSARYDDWPYLQGMDSITDSALSAEMGITSSGIAPGSPDAPFIWEPGTSFAYGENFLYEAGGKITFKAELTPADENGDLVHDKHTEVEVDAKIK